MERRVLLAVFLCLLVLVGYQYLVIRPAQQRQAELRRVQQQQEQVRRQQQGSEAPAGAGAPEGAAAGETKAATPQVPAVETLVAEEAERQIAVSTPSVEATFSNRGGVLTGWRLRNYQTNGSPVNLVPSRLPEGVQPAFSLTTGDAEVDARLASATFKVVSAPDAPVTGTATVAFEYRDASGIAARKTFTFNQDGHAYVLGISAEVTRNGQRLPVTLHSGPGLGDEDRAAGSSSYFSPSYYQPPQAIFWREGDVRRISIGDLASEPRHEGLFRFIGIDDQYFLGALLPGESVVAVTYQPVQVPAEGERQARQLLAFGARQAGGAIQANYYLGPKHFDTLAAVDRELTRVINFGIFAWLVVPLLRSLNWIYGYVGNYGWAIIILTVLINLAIFPLRHKSVVSMRKMQELQPEMKAIQDRYAHLKATDPQRQKMNAELMNLYRERGVNPASGCVPMLLTLPVLFAFYSLLSQAIEIRGAPFIWWIRDLSAHDPLYITPLLMGASMVLQQKMTPSTADPMQQRMMMLMPIVFTFMFLWAPSGLVIYWFVSNVWTIGQQYLTNRIIGPPTVRAPRPPAERQLKRAGGSKSAAAARANR